MTVVERIEKETEELKDKLLNHDLYNSLTDIEDVKVFMSLHVFAVWDFMSLLKSLQNHLTCTTLPWIPKENTNTARFINEIVLGEETDINEQGRFRSHFDMYLDSMTEIGVDMKEINDFINYLKDGRGVDYSLNKMKVDNVISDFINFTFDIIKSGKVHVIASAFTFGREGLIADMFIEILNNSNKIKKTSYKSMIYYLERHIELDGDEHGPMSMKMMEELCQDDPKKIDEAIEIAKLALKHRIKLWDRINEKINC